MNDVKVQNRSCKEICKKFKAKKPVDGGRYEAGQAHCQICDIWIDYRGAHTREGLPATEDSVGWSCNCCNYRVRQKPRNRIYKEKLRKSNEEIIEDNEKELEDTNGILKISTEKMNKLISDSLNLIRQDSVGIYEIVLLDELSITEEEFGELLPRLLRIEDIVEEKESYGKDNIQKVLRSTLVKETNENPNNDEFFKDMNKMDFQNTLDNSESNFINNKFNNTSISKTAQLKNLIKKYPYYETPFDKYHDREELQYHMLVSTTDLQIAEFVLKWEHEHKRRISKKIASEILTDPDEFFSKYYKNNQELIEEAEEVKRIRDQIKEIENKVLERYAIREKHKEQREKSNQDMEKSKQDIREECLEVIKYKQKKIEVRLVKEVFDEYVKLGSIRKVCERHPWVNEEKIRRHLQTPKRLPKELQEKAHGLLSDPESSMAIAMYAVDYYKWDGNRKDGKKVVDFAIELQKGFENNNDLRLELAGKKIRK